MYQRLLLLSRSLTTAGLFAPTKGARSLSAAPSLADGGFAAFMAQHQHIKDLIAAGNIAAAEPLLVGHTTESTRWISKVPGYVREIVDFAAACRVHKMARGQPPVPPTYIEYRVSKG